MSVYRTIGPLFFPLGSEGRIYSSDFISSFSLLQVAFDMTWFIKFYLSPHIHVSFNNEIPSLFSSNVDHMQNHLRIQHEL